MIASSLARRYRAIGIADSALRRRHRCATVAIDAETHERIDVLPYRTPDTLEAWLREHPGVEVVCRDGSATYAPAGVGTAVVESGLPWRCNVESAVAVVSPRARPRTQPARGHGGQGHHRPGREPGGARRTDPEAVHVSRIYVQRVALKSFYGSRCLSNGSVPDGEAAVDVPGLLDLVDQGDRVVLIGEASLPVVADDRGSRLVR